MIIVLLRSFCVSVLCIVQRATIMRLQHMKRLCELMRKGSSSVQIIDLEWCWQTCRAYATTCIAQCNVFFWPFAIYQRERQRTIQNIHCTNNAQNCGPVIGDGFVFCFGKTGTQVTNVSITRSQNANLLVTLVLGNLVWMYIYSFTMTLSVWLQIVWRPP